MVQEQSTNTSTAKAGQIACNTSMKFASINRLERRHFSWLRFWGNRVERQTIVERARARAGVCVCVSHSVSKSFLHAGGSDRVCGITANEDVHILW